MYLYCIVIMFMPLIIKILKLTLCFFTNSCLVLVFSAVWFCPHDVIMYGGHMGAQRQTAPPPDPTFAIQTYGCFSFIEYVPCQRWFIFNEIANKIPDNFTLNCKEPSEMKNDNGSKVNLNFINWRPNFCHRQNRTADRIEPQRRPKLGKNLSKTQCKFKYFYYQRHKRYSTDTYGLGFYSVLVMSMTNVLIFFALNFKGNTR